MNRRLLLVSAGALATGGAVAATSFARMGSAESYAAAMAALRAPLGSDPALLDLVRYATLAPSGHNTQPWRFRITDDQARISPDFSRRTTIVDPDDHHLYVSLGCAAENLALAAQSVGRASEARFDQGGVLLDFASGAAVGSPLFGAIPHRQSTRAEYDGRPVGISELGLLESAAETPGVDVELVTDRPRLDRLRELVMAGASAQMADPAFVAELAHWMRFNPQAALRHGDGLYSAASGNPILPTWLASPLFKVVFQPKSENEKYDRHLRSSAGVAVFIGARADPAHWVRVGRACQRFALQATALGLKTAFINQPVEVANLRGELATLAGAPGTRPDIVMRFGRGPSLPMSPRRPAGAVIDA